MVAVGQRPGDERPGLVATGYPPADLEHDPAGPVMPCCLRIEAARSSCRQRKARRAEMVLPDAYGPLAMITAGTDSCATRPFASRTHARTAQSWLPLDGPSQGAGEDVL
jgi:hypothetical protein